MCPNMLQVLIAARTAELRVFYALHIDTVQAIETWKYIAPVQNQAVAVSDLP